MIAGARQLSLDHYFVKHTPAEMKEDTRQQPERFRIGRLMALRH